ncbi:MAG: type II toxin-antitoxin system VapC family toxin [Gammaproteobacteria bacterium]|nr:type II toxin-antitoxin system VapC family toxin [Gammaproteobacteria bacterium]MCY4337641.1 type II toxin-antitoxin system VapC family toxin [Gammaproteobacteria bacterium]
MDKSTDNETSTDRPIVYMETTVVSYLTARPSRDVVIAGHQQSTREWWEDRQSDFRVVASPLVLQEASRGDNQAAQSRLDILRIVELLEINDDATTLARELIESGIIPETSLDDALHVAIAAVNGCNYLATWNYRHLVSAGVRARIETFCRDKGYEAVIICTPEDLLEEAT